ncbi:hypothetical protein D9M70_618840 [compost metagenome]
MQGAPQKTFSSVCLASSRNSRAAAGPPTTMIWSRPVTIEVVPSGTTALAKLVSDIFEHSTCRCPSIMPGARYLPVASTILVSGPI